MAQGHAFGAGLADIARQRVDEGVLMIDQQHLAALAGLRSGRSSSRGGGAVAGDRRKQRRALEPTLIVLADWVAVEEQGRTGADLADPVFHADRAQGEAGVHVAVEGQPADGAAIPAARRALLLLNKADRPELWRSGYGDSPGVAEEPVERVKFGA